MIIQQEVSTNFAAQEGRIVVARAQDVEPLLEQSKAMHREGYHVTKGGDKLAGVLPDVLIETYIAQKGITFQQFLQDKSHVRNMLNDPALADFRVWKGAI